jgi:hypothetical protein
MAKKSTRKRKTSKRAKSGKKRGRKRWSQKVTRESDALTLESGVFS